MPPKIQSRFAEVIRILMIGVAVILADTLASSEGAQAWTLKTLHSFCTKANCEDGEYPVFNVVLDPSGNLYGLASDSINSIIYELSPDSERRRWSYKVLHKFCRRDPHCLHGGAANSLIMDVAGNLYGAASLGGAYRSGAIFQLERQGSDWAYTDVFDFCPKIHTNCTHGQYPGGLTYAGAPSGALWDGVSPLFGVATSHPSDDLAFTLWRNGSLWSEGATFRFSAFGVGYLLVDQTGDLYGTLSGGGLYRQGLIYKLRFHRPRGETVLYNFCAGGGTCVDGRAASGQLVEDQAGALYGIAEAGGTHDAGVAYVFDQASGQYGVIYNFCSLADCADGQYPFYGMTADGKGNLLGVASRGGAHDGGVIFELANLGSWSESVIYDFCSEAACEDGAFPDGPLTIDSEGNFYGTTIHGGANGDYGTVFELTP